MRCPQRIYYDGQAKVWVAWAPRRLFVTQGRTIQEAWRALREGVQLLRKHKRRRFTV